MTENFDWTQFITFETDENKIKVSECVREIFGEMDFNSISKKDIEQVKIVYYNDFWKTFVFELENSEFLYGFGEWNSLDEPPLKIVDFIKGIDVLIDRLEITKIEIIICSFAENETTNNMVVDANSNDILEKLFLMCINSFVCPDNLIINYHCNV